MNNLTPEQLSEILDICASCYVRYVMDTDARRDEPALYIIECLAGLQRGWNNATSSIAGYAQGQRTALNKAANAQDNADMYKKQYDNLRKERETVTDNMIKMLEMILEQHVTHGQKNGMIVLLIAMCRKWKYGDTSMSDIPF